MLAIHIQAWKWKIFSHQTKVKKQPSSRSSEGEKISHFKSNYSSDYEKMYTLFLCAKGTNELDDSECPIQFYMLAFPLTKGSVCALGQGLKISICSSSVNSTSVKPWGALHARSELPKLLFDKLFTKLGKEKRITHSYLREIKEIQTVVV